jgi:hypothetical protein
MKFCERPFRGLSNRHQKSVARKGRAKRAVAADFCV